MTERTKNALKHDTIELAANQIYDRLTIFFSIMIGRGLTYERVNL